MAPKSAPAFDAPTLIQEDEDPPDAKWYEMTYDLCMILPNGERMTMRKTGEIFLVGTVEPGETFRATLCPNSYEGYMRMLVELSKNVNRVFSHFQRNTPDYQNFWKPLFTVRECMTTMPPDLPGKFMFYRGWWEVVS